jgi:hypothetical protein
MTYKTTLWENRPTGFPAAFTCPVKGPDFIQISIFVRLILRFYLSYVNDFRLLTAGP